MILAPPTAEILSQGDEVITGQTIDSNAAWIAERLTELGFTLQRHTAVGDCLEDIRDLVIESATRASLCICTGGLGPTEDDLTAQAVAHAFNRPLELDEVALRQISDFFERANRVMVDANRKQACLPQGAIRLDNDWGTAPGFAVNEKNAWLIFLPGVPREMKQMFPHCVEPLLVEKFKLQPGRLVTFRTVGIGESTLQEQIGTFQHPEVTLSYRTMHPENQIKLRFRGDFPKSEIYKIVHDVGQRIGHDFIFAIEGLEAPGGSLVEVIARQLKARKEQIALVEISSGGHFAATCSALPDGSEWLIQAWVLPPNAERLRAALREWDLEEGLVAEHGAVSAPVAGAIAKAICQRSGATYGLAITGVQQTSEAQGERTTGLVYIGLATPQKVYEHPLQVFGNARRIQRMATAEALDLLRRHLLGVPQR